MFLGLQAKRARAPFLGESRLVFPDAAASRPPRRWRPNVTAPDAADLAANATPAHVPTMGREPSISVFRCFRAPCVFSAATLEISHPRAECDKRDVTSFSPTTHPAIKRRYPETPEQDLRSAAKKITLPTPSSVAGAAAELSVSLSSMECVGLACPLRHPGDSKPLFMAASPEGAAPRRDCQSTESRSSPRCNRCVG